MHDARDNNMFTCQSAFNRSKTRVQYVVLVRNNRQWECTCNA